MWIVWLGGFGWGILRSGAEIVRWRGVGEGRKWTNGERVVRWRIWPYWVMFGGVRGDNYGEGGTTVLEK